MPDRDRLRNRPGRGGGAAANREPEPRGRSTRRQARPGPSPGRQGVSSEERATRRQQFGRGALRARLATLPGARGARALGRGALAVGRGVRTTAGPVGLGLGATSLVAQALSPEERRRQAEAADLRVRQGAGPSPGTHGVSGTAATDPIREREAQLRREGRELRGEEAAQPLDTSVADGADIELMGETLGRLPNQVGSPRVLDRLQPPAGPDGTRTLRPDRGTAAGPATIATLRRDDPQLDDVQGRLNVEAESLPGVPGDQQDVAFVEDGQGGRGAVTLRRGARERIAREAREMAGDPDIPTAGGGTLSVVGGPTPETQAANEAARQRMAMADERRQAEQREQRRAQLRRQVTNTRGFNQSFSDMAREGLRRRQARSELQQLDTLEQIDQQAMSQAAAQAQARAIEGQELSLSDQLALAREQRQQAQFGQQMTQAERDERRAQRDEFRTDIDRRFDRDDPRERQQAELVERLAFRSGIFDPVEDRELVLDLVELTGEMDREAQRGSGVNFPILNALTSRNMPAQETAQELIASLFEAQDTRETRSGFGAGRPGPFSPGGGVSPFEREFVNFRGQDIRLDDLSPSARQRFNRIAQELQNRVGG